MHSTNSGQEPIHLASNKEELPWCLARKKRFRQLSTRETDIWNAKQVSNAAADPQVCRVCVATAERLSAIREMSRKRVELQAGYAARRAAEINADTRQRVLHLITP